MKRMKRTLDLIRTINHPGKPARATFWALWAILVFALFSPTAEAQAPYTTLKAGEFREIEQHLTVNVVFVGYEPGTGWRDINDARFRELLPQTQRNLSTILSDPDFHPPGTPYTYTGQKYTLGYNIVYANSSFENAFFGYLGSIAQQREEIGWMQGFYNAVNPHRSLTITDNVWIEAPLVERWLGENAGPRLGLNSAQHTVFLINWYGRSDFKFHEYVKTDETDAETGYNVGAELDGYDPETDTFWGIQSRMLGWGGTPPDDPESGTGRLNRLWFVDLSAGPDYWSGAWNIEDPHELRGYRIPNVWEYGNTTAYRPFTDISGDLALIVRYAAVNQMFVPSPIYHPRHATPGLPDNIQLDVTAFQGYPGRNVLDFLDSENMRSRIAYLRPQTNFSIDVDSRPYTSDVSAIVDCFNALYYGNPSCFGPRYGGDSSRDPYYYFNPRLGSYLEGDAEYELPNFILATPTSQQGPYSGYAMPTPGWRPAFPINFYSPLLTYYGTGIGRVAIHEAGHHLGLNHSFNNYDYEWDSFYVASGYQLPAAFGMYTNSVMSYVWVNDEFSQFDRDAMNRFMTSVYINDSNKILGQRYGRRIPSGRGFEAFRTADSKATQAIAAYQAMNYIQAAALAKESYKLVESVTGPAAPDPGDSTPAMNPLERMRQLKLYEEKYGDGVTKRVSDSRLTESFNRMRAQTKNKRVVEK